MYRRFMRFNQPVDSVLLEIMDACHQFILFLAIEHVRGKFRYIIYDAGAMNEIRVE